MSRSTPIVPWTRTEQNGDKAKCRSETMSYLSDSLTNRSFKAVSLMPTHFSRKSDKTNCVKSRADVENNSKRTVSCMKVKDHYEPFTRAISILWCECKLFDYYLVCKKGPDRGLMTRYMLTLILHTLKGEFIIQSMVKKKRTLGLWHLWCWRVFTAWYVDMNSFRRWY